MHCCIWFQKGSKTAHRHKLLVIKLDAIGDFILWLDFARGLRELYPAGKYEITLLANQAWGDFAAGIPLVRRCYTRRSDTGHP